MKKSPKPFRSSLSPPQSRTRRPPSKDRLRPSSPKKSEPPAPAASAAGERLQKLLAAAGLGSRRALESWIEAGRVRVNGRTARLGERATPGDRVEVDGRRLNFATRPLQPRARVLLYHKPVGELVTRSDPEGRPTVFSRLPPGRWIAIGRLDLNSSGLLLFTDSGELANRLMHPRYRIEREYAARVHGELGPAELERLATGVQLEDGPAAFSRIEASDGRKSTGSNRWYRVSLHEGRNREVRRLFEAVGARVSRLVRLRYGPVELPGELAPGRWRELDARSLEGLFRE